MTDLALMNRAMNDAGIPLIATRATSLTGGCIHRVFRLECANESHVVVKVAAASNRNLLVEEAAGLRAIAASHTVRVPAVLGEGVSGGQALLFIEYLEARSASATDWSRFGEELARFHRSDSSGRKYGFEIDNHLGTTLQPNRWEEDWVEFNRIHRLGHQLHLAKSSGRIGTGDIHRIDMLTERLDELLPRRPAPALLHGDLWSGNAFPTSGGTIAVIDPAPYYGDGWADIAMMRLFGGFPSTCFDTYAANLPDCSQIEPRIAVYQLYHLLNHVNLFGAGYLGQTMATVGRLGF